MLNHYDVPGYGYQIKLGHTTLTEQWNPEHGASMNHFMMGHLNNLLIPYIIGIWRHGDSYTIAPHPVGDLTWCKGAMGDIRVSWHLAGDTFVLQADIPEGHTATVTLPYSHRQQTVPPGHHRLTDIKNQDKSPF
ncbi:MAG: hydrolase, partial [Bacteroidales bacterium]|nr:hydrolase [Bacteroidales bacterium]